MGEELRSISLCLLDDVNLADPLHLDEFKIRHFRLDDLQALLGETEASDRLKVYAEFPWARVEQAISISQAKDPCWDLRLQQSQLSWAHAGVRSWYPFDELLGTLNLLKPAGGPVIGRQFYYWLEPLSESDRKIDRIVYGEPLWDYNEPDSEDIHPLVSEYDLGPSDTEQFSRLRKQLAECLATNGALNNSHLKTAIHYFENGDRKITPRPLPGSFDAIEPLMSYEAALEALLIRKKDCGVEDNLSKRVTALMKKTGKRTDKVADFTRRVFWLRSKVAHGARPIKEIENLITHKPNDAIVDNERKKKKEIPGGTYASLLIENGMFPGFLVNLRELTRISIRFFCDALSQGQSKETTIESLGKSDY